MDSTSNGSNRPNIVLILADDMGYSDIGCFASEISTPSIDRLAEGGVRFTQAYNCARCCPSRASLYTGLYPHQTGVGLMVNDLGLPGYRGFINENCVTIAEALKTAGYTTILSGKWHVGGDYNPRKPEEWRPGAPGFPTPQQRGFDRFFGMLRGGGSYFDPKVLMLEDTFVDAEGDEFYFTDAVTDYALGALDECGKRGEPFFLHLSYTAPHWPLHAWEEDIAKYEGKYLCGWDEIRTRRHEELRGLGIVDRKWGISKRDEMAPPWEQIKHREWENQRMAVYAAQIDRMDQGIERIMAKLRSLGVRENTLVFFLSDNGGCAEFLAEDTGKPEPFRYNFPTRDGKPMTIGNIPGVKPGPAYTFQSYDLPWANASNTPFKLYKHWVHEGGISTPLIVSWPAKIEASRIVHSTAHVIDIMATCLEAAATSYPTEYGGCEILPLEGESLLPACLGRDWRREKPLFWEHEGNRAVRQGRWKLVCRYPGDWELYDMVEDRTELNDLSDKNRDKVKELVAAYNRWADYCGVLPWPVEPDIDRVDRMAYQRRSW
jgi:arylsulfatase A-like enzyme